MKPQFPFKVIPSPNKRLSLFNFILLEGHLVSIEHTCFECVKEAGFLCVSAEATFDSRLMAFNSEPL